MNCAGDYQINQNEHRVIDALVLKLPGGKINSAILQRWDINIEIVQLWERHRVDWEHGHLSLDQGDHPHHNYHRQIDI